LTDPEAMTHARGGHLMASDQPRGISRRGFIGDGLRGAVGSALVPLVSQLRALPQSAPTVLTGPDDLGQLERLIRELMTQGAVPGVSIAVIKDASVVWHRELGVRDMDSRAPVDEHTLFEAASVSKTVFSYAVMQLRDRGTLSLDTPLTTYTTERVLDGDPRLDRITARQVLSHTSGFPNFRTRAEPLRIQFEPGERFEYSGEGYWYLQLVVTHLVGSVDPHTCKTYEAGLEVCATDIDSYLKRNVLMPLGMGSSTYVWNETLERHAARPHDPVGKPLPLARSGAADAARYAAMGGLRTTALEYADFLIEILAPRVGAPFQLSAATRQDMLRPQVRVDDSNSWALGWEVHQTPRGDLIQHEGGQTGFLAFTAASVERRSAYVILTNSANGWKVFYDARFVALMNRILLE
jgi:CubicO group peptidase (beta-lactamase class C family)